MALYSVITVVKVDDNKPCKYFLCDQGGGRRTQANWQLRHQTGHRFYSNLPGSVCVCVRERERESCIEMCLIDCCIGPKLCVMCYIRYEARQSRCWWWLVLTGFEPRESWCKFLSRQSPVARPGEREKSESCTGEEMLQNFAACTKLCC